MRGMNIKMAYITLNYQSPTIGMNQNLTVILPEDTSFLKVMELLNHLKRLCCYMDYQVMPHHI